MFIRLAPLGEHFVRLFQGKILWEGYKNIFIREEAKSPYSNIPRQLAAGSRKGKFENLGFHINLEAKLPRYPADMERSGMRGQLAAG